MEIAGDMLSPGKREREKAEVVCRGAGSLIKAEDPEECSMWFWAARSLEQVSL